jgi:hypothetical protein
MFMWIFQDDNEEYIDKDNEYCKHQNYNLDTYKYKKL